MPAHRPEVLAPSRALAWRLAAKHLRRGETGRVPALGALGALIDAGYSAREAARIVETMIAQGTP